MDVFSGSYVAPLNAVSVVSSSSNGDKGVCFVYSPTATLTEVYLWAH